MKLYSQLDIITKFNSKKSLLNGINSQILDVIPYDQKIDNMKYYNIYTLYKHRQLLLISSRLYKQLLFIKITILELLAFLRYSNNSPLQQLYKNVENAITADDLYNCFIKLLYNKTLTDEISCKNQHYINRLNKLKNIINLLYDKYNKSLKMIARTDDNMCVLKFI